MQARIPRLVMAAPMVAVLAATLAASGSAPTSGTDMPALTSISSRIDGAKTTVLIEASEPVAYLTSQPDPLTVLVDLRNVSASGLGDLLIATPIAPVSGVEIEGASSPDGAPVARVRLSLDRAANYSVRSARNVILVEIDRSGTARSLRARESIAPVAPVRQAPRAPRVTDTAAVAARTVATELRAIEATELPTGYSVLLSGNGSLVASSVEEARDLPPRVLLDFHGVSSGAVPAVTTVNRGDLERVRVGMNSRDPLITRVVIDLARRIPYTVERVGDDLRVLFTRAAAATAAVILLPPPTETAVPPAPPEPPAPEAEPLAVEAAPVVEPARPALPPTADAGQPPAAAVPALQGQAQRQFTGDAVTLDFQGADLRAVLRTFAEISNLNIVIDPSINGTVDVSLRDVPWDQALDIILRANKLGYSVDGTIVRIVPLTVLAQEREEQRKLAEATALAGDLRVLTRALSYARASDLVPIITRSSLSSRGDVQVDARTNTLIIRDLADRLTSAAELLTTLDRPQPQVEIEARIVQTTRSYAQSLGVQWGFNGRVDPALGGSTGLAFPSSAGVTGTTTLPAAAPSSAVGIALGSINGALNLDMALTALESAGKGRLLSTPRVTTQNNVEAEITQGVQIPIQTVSNNTVTVSFKDAALTLRVTPQITASNTVIMRIFMENATANFGLAVNGIPPIDTQRAVTTVLVADGDTTVIGGIYVSNEQSTDARTPFLHRIPLLGWLFRRETVDEENRELLIFITPRLAR